MPTMLKAREGAPAPQGIVVALATFGSVAVLTPSNMNGAPPAVMPADVAFALFEPINPPEYPA